MKHAVLGNIDVRSGMSVFERAFLLWDPDYEQCIFAIWLKWEFESESSSL